MIEVKIDGEKYVPEESVTQPTKVTVTQKCGTVISAEDVSGQMVLRINSNVFQVFREDLTYWFGTRAGEEITRMNPSSGGSSSDKDAVKAYAEALGMSVDAATPQTYNWDRVPENGGWMCYATHGTVKNPIPGVMGNEGTLIYVPSVTPSSVKIYDPDYYTIEHKSNSDKQTKRIEQLEKELGEAKADNAKLKKLLDDANTPKPRGRPKKIKMDKDEFEKAEGERIKWSSMDFMDLDKMEICPYWFHVTDEGLISIPEWAKNEHATKLPTTTVTVHDKTTAYKWGTLTSHLPNYGVRVAKNTATNEILLYAPMIDKRCMDSDALEEIKI